ncbi:MAG TPA: rRNA adenine N-6-methyltransferase family protein [Verrucomicrobiales bacterium]|nr:rRNA adenine N-6-methyltransferase family protein [Verrucomicrobiales bacterium]
MGESTDLREPLKGLDVVPSRRLGQNSLLDPATARDIAAALDPQPIDCLVEIGVGTGSLSDALSGLGRRLLLIEKDPRLTAYLQQRYAGRPDVSVMAGDALRFDVRTLFAEVRVRLAGNLPYSTRNPKPTRASSSSSPSSPAAFPPSTPGFSCAWLNTVLRSAASS